MDKQEALKQVAGEVVACRRCELYKSAKKAVPGVGPAETEIMLIGEAPGYYENEQGLPFVGASGKFLDELLQKAGVRRSDVFITNVIKHRPPGNRDPEADELAACRGFLETQIATLNPKVIVTLGRFSMGYFMPNARISAVHGSARWVQGRLIVPMFHPAAALHQPTLRDSLLEDFSRLPKFIDMANKSRLANQPGVAGLNTAGEIAPPAAAKAPTADAFAAGQPGLFNDRPAEDPPDDKPVQLSLF